MARSKVFARRTRPDAVDADLLRLVELAAAGSALDPSAPTLLVAHAGGRPIPGERSTPWQATGVVNALRGNGLGDIRGTWSGQPPRPSAPARAALREVGVDDRPLPSGRVRYEPRARMRVLPKGFPAGITLCARALGRNLALLPVPCAHGQTALVGAMHGVAHALLADDLRRVALWTADALVDALAIADEVCRGRLAVLDGTAVALGDGGATASDYLLASRDLVALDAVAAALLGFDPLRLTHLRHAHEDRLGVADPRDIELVGDDLSHARWSPRAHREATPSPCAAAAARVAAYTPLPALAARCQRLVTALAWREEPLAARWRETAWGARYERGEHEA